MEGGGVNSDSFESWKANGWQFGSLKKAKIKFQPGLGKTYIAAPLKGSELEAAVTLEGRNESRRIGF